MGDTGWNDDADIVPAAMIIAIDEEAHHAGGQTGANIAQKNLGATLKKKHDVPLFAIVRSQGIILRLIHEQTAKPFLRRRVGRNLRRMNMKTFRAICEHARGRPLPWPKFYFSKHSLRFAG